MNILELQDVVKQYEHHRAVDGVSFNVPKGSIFGLLGPNGAGKTSIIRIITTITRADSGVVFLDGEPLNSSHPSQIGYMPEERGLYKKMAVGEHLIYLARLKGLSAKKAKDELTYWMEKFEITDWWNKKIEELSKGMQQKVQFIATVVHEPKLLILDEPFSGLDPINTNLIKDEIYALNQKGVSIIFSTHRMEQVEEICNQIVLINKGKKVLEGKVGEIRERFSENHFSLTYKGHFPDSLKNAIRIIKESNGEKLDFFVNPPLNPQAFLRDVVQQGVELKEWREILPSLNEIFIKQVGENG
jgi:ABC-2 type transport system ATP-binding protein